MALVALGNKSVPEKSTDGETPLSKKDDEAGKVIATPAATKKMASHTAKGKVQTSSMKSIEAEAEIIGLPYLKARETITIENIGKKFSGDWRITKVRHQISSSGYTCSLSLAKNDHSGTKKAKDTPKKSATSKGSTNNSSTSSKPHKTKLNVATGKVVE